MTVNPSSITVAEFITNKVRESGKTQREIAIEAGFPSPNIITMFKTGDTKVPLERVGPLAKALEVDTAYLLRLVMTEYAPDTWDAIERTLSGVVPTANEVELIRAHRSMNGGRDDRVKLVQRDAELLIVRA